MLAIHLAETIGHAPLRVLDDLSRDVWKGHAGALLTDVEAQELAEAIHNRRIAQRDGSSAPTPKTPSAIVSEASGPVSAKPQRPWSYFPPKRPQRSPDRVRSLERRRTLAATSPLPPKLACKFTTGELSVLRIVADEVAAKGTCVLSIPEIASRAGVGVTKARMALRIAASLGLIVVSERRVPYRPNLTNVIRIVGREWLAWIARTKPRQSIEHSWAKPADTNQSKPSYGVRGFTFKKATESKGYR